MQHFLITGATGFIGRHLVARLRGRGCAVTVLTRDAARARRLLPGVTPVEDLATIDRATRLDGIVNLAGARILGPPWTSGRRALLRGSRLGTTRQLVDLVGWLEQRPALLVSASAVGFYGLSGDRDVDETAPSQPIFQSQLCADWEAVAGEAAGNGTRVVLPRFGVVLGRDGGALPQLALPVRLGGGAVLGKGRQPFPWIHLEDALGLIDWAIADAQVTGPLNAVAPQIVSHREFQQSMGRVLRRPIWLSVPAAPLRLVLGEMSQLLLDGQRVVPRRAQEGGYPWRFPQLEPALQDLLGRRRPQAG